MNREFRLPDVGEGLTEADIVSWHVKPGDTVTINQVIVDIETAKAVVELPSPYAGTVTALLVEEGQTVDVGTPIIAVNVPGPEDAKPGGAQPQPEQDKAAIKPSAGEQFGAAYRADRKQGHRIQGYRVPANRQVHNLNVVGPGQLFVSTFGAGWIDRDESISDQIRQHLLYLAV